HFNIADIYIMPSTGEGFGIVFIEALFYGKPVIAGNQDGSVDALGNGEFGLLVNPNDNDEIVAAVRKVLANKEACLPDEEKVMEKFGFDRYKNSWHKILYPAKASFKSIHKENPL
ncbi:MAG: glycosyltransferase family 4 protein, partial [Ferruginibacter sp.]